MGQPSPRGHYIGQAWLVILLALLYGGGLAGVQTTLSGKIAENKRNETYDQIPSLVSGADGTRTVELIIEGKDGKEARVYQALDQNNVPCGWVVPASGQGFADRIDLLIGLDVNLEAITRMYVLDQKETPGLGDYITGKSFRERFRDKPAGAELAAVKADPQAENEVRALTGATISSQSVCDIVNATLANLREPIREQAGRCGPAPELPAS